MGFDPSASIVIIIIIPVLFLFNLLIAAILYVIKKDYYSRLFLLNALLSSIIFFILFSFEMRRNRDKIMEVWEFKKGDTTYILYRSKISEDFHLDYSLEPRMSSGYISGTWQDSNDIFILKSDDSSKYYIKGNLLIGFRNSTDTIKLKKSNH